VLVQGKLWAGAPAIPPSADDEGRFCSAALSRAVKLRDFPQEIGDGFCSQHIDL
jgi:hypothetical protein